MFMRRVMQHNIKRQYKSRVSRNIRHSRLLSQVQETVLHKMHCTHTNIWVELFCVFWKTKQTSFAVTVKRSISTTYRWRQQHESKLHLLYLNKHLGGIMEIFPHSDVDMWGHLNKAFQEGTDECPYIQQIISFGLRL